MFLPKLELDLMGRHLLCSPLDISSCGIWPTEVDTHLCGDIALQPREIRLIQKPIPHGHEETLEVRATKVGAAPEFRERVDVRANGVEVDVGGGVLVETLGEVGMDAKELLPTSGRGGGLLLERREQCLEPLEGMSILADPDELDSA